MVRVVLCNNGLPWKAEAQRHMDQAGFGGQVTWEHLSHKDLIALLQKTVPVGETLSMVGEVVVEQLGFRRVLLGRIPVGEVKTLMDRWGDRVLERNIRRYLGPTSRVNQAIRATLADPDHSGDFYFFNNGITITCTQLRHNALQRDNHRVKLENMQIINGGQTCRSIQEALSQPGPEAREAATVLVRLYELEEDDPDLVAAITYATNSQNPVELRDLRANDAKQRELELSVAELGYRYRRRREANGGNGQSIPTSVAAEVVLAVWRRRPHQARNRRNAFLASSTS